MLAEKYGAQYVHRTNRRGFKAGAINDILAQLDAKYLVLLDADQRPRHDFLSEMIPLLDADPRLAFIQTPQHYGNRTSSRIANPAGSQQDVFYTNISEGKSASNVMFACGTNVVLRLAALQAVGGFDEGSVTEDFATSIKLHSQGYRSYYYHHIFVKGEGPTSITAYYKQQMRWAYGTTRALGQLSKLFFTHPRRLSVGQWWEYFLSGTWYFVGWAFFLLMLCPIAFLIFDIHPLLLNDAVAYFAFLIPYLIFSTFVFMVSMSLRSYPVKHQLLGIIMNNLAFPVYMLAVFYAIIGKKIPFVVTPKTNANQASLKYYWPHIVMIIILAFAVVFGIYVRIGQLTLPLVMNVVWSLYAIGVLCCFVYLLKETGELSINDVDAFEQFVKANPQQPLSF
jgi:cellulose synthase (UDP-forming)